MESLICAGQNGAKGHGNYVVIERVLLIIGPWYNRFNTVSVLYFPACCFFFFSLNFFFFICPVGLQFTATTQTLVLELINRFFPQVFLVAAEEINPTSLRFV